jgi:iron complex outermembrane receptor protein
VQDQDISYRYGKNLQKNPDFAAQLEQELHKNARLQANLWAQYVNFDKLNGNTCYYQGGMSCLTSGSASLTPAQANRNVVQFYTQQGALGYREQGASLIYSARFHGALHELAAGADYRRLSAADSERFFNTPVSPSAPQGRFDSATRGEGRQSFEGVFAQAKWSPMEALDVSFGGRLDHYQIDRRVSTRTLAGGTESGGPLPASSKSAFDPSVTARYAISGPWSLRAARYKAFRAPGFNNLIRTYGTGTNTTIANPDLVPEDLTGWEAGSDYRDERISFGASYFVYDIRNMIATYTASGAGAPQQVQVICGGPTLPTCGGAARYYTNDQDGQSHGVELTGALRYSDALDFNAFYTHTESYLTRRGSIVTDPVGVQLAGIPKNVALLGMRWKPLDTLQTYAELRYTGAMLLDTTSNHGATRFGQASSTVLNASVNYAWNRSITLFASALNLFNRQYGETPYAASQPYNQVLSMPRTFNVGVRARF